jgi:hypothetical protein
MMETTRLRASYTYWGKTMKEIKCSQCSRVLSRPVDNGHQIEGYYLYNQSAYCSDCWDKKESGMVVLAKNNDPTDKNGQTTWVVIKDRKRGQVRPG